MAVLLSSGLILTLGIIIGLIFTVIGLFVGHIILFDSIFLAVISGIICNQVWGVHPALCLLIAAALFGLLFWLQKTGPGFWIISVLLSVFWAFVFGALTYILAGEDRIWFYVVMGLGLILMMGLHLKARKT